MARDPVAPRAEPLPLDIHRDEHLAALTDLYQLTMACAYCRAGRAEDEAVFHLFFRAAPHHGGFAVAAGVAQVARYLERLRFAPALVEYLAGLRGGDDRALFDQAFLDRLLGFEPGVAIDAVAEGTVLFPLEPVLRIEGPLWQCQLLETALLNLINFPTLIATKAARLCHLAAAGAPVLEFGLRRAQGIDGGLTASWAAYLGGCAATSNVLAGRVLGLPVRGTQAHSWVLSFDSEGEAFAAWLAAMPGNPSLLVDTFATMRGVDRAIEAARAVAGVSPELDSLRLDSGDLLALSRAARHKLDAGGLANTRIVASGDLDEHRVAELAAAGAPIDVWGVGTRLVVGDGDPALTGVYKLAAFRRARATPWRYRAKRSDDPSKATLPGRLQVARRRSGEEITGDVLFDLDRGRDRRAGAESEPAEELLSPLVRGRSLARVLAPAAEVRERVAGAVARLPAGLRRLRDPAPYPVELDPGLRALCDEVEREREVERLS